MTDNEKAATFIGWKPSRDQWFVKRDGSGILLIADANGKPAPDMEDPRNYMNANVAWSILTHRDSWTASPLNSISPRGYGHSPIEALAALYDLQHEEVTDGSSPTD